MRLRWVVCRMAELPEFLSLTNHQSDDLFCLPFNISLQRGQRPTIFLAESIKEKRQCQMGDPVEIECENQPPVYEGPSILWIECVPNNGQGTLLVAPRLIRQALPCTDSRLVGSFARNCGGIMKLSVNSAKRMLNRSVTY